MSKCSKCQNDFIPLLKSDGLPYKTCDRCKCTEKKYRDKHKEQIKLYRDQYYLNNQDKIKKYREVNKDKIHYFHKIVFFFLMMNDHHQNKENNFMKIIRIK
jgi:hypothetical protein